ncbi:hypothetical protein AALC25_00250 [Lachnospiraceae bacterium 29-84]
MVAEDKMADEYFEWIYGMMCKNGYQGLPFRKLFSCLHKIAFTYTIPLDGNRAEDGVDLRYRFGRRCGYSDAETAAFLDIRACSVLEMMAALAIRCEEHIMDDPDIGDRTGRWFWEMISNLGLSHMKDKGFDPHHTKAVIGRFLNRKYGQEGDGGLFWIPGCMYDLRTVEIWYQMCWYMDRVLEG